MHLMLISVLTKNWLTDFPLALEGKSHNQEIEALDADKDRDLFVALHAMQAISQLHETKMPSIDDLDLEAYQVDTWLNDLRVQDTQVLEKLIAGVSEIAKAILTHSKFQDFLDSKELQPIKNDIDQQSLIKIASESSRFMKNFLPTNRHESGYRIKNTAIAGLINKPYINFGNKVYAIINLSTLCDGAAFSKNTDGQVGTGLQFRVVKLNDDIDEDTFTTELTRHYKEVQNRENGPNSEADFEGKEIRARISELARDLLSGSDGYPEYMLNNTTELAEFSIRIDPNSKPHLASFAKPLAIKLNNMAKQKSHGLELQIENKEEEIYSLSYYSSDSDLQNFYPGDLE